MAAEKKAGVDADLQDRTSDLPTPILAHILSFLPHAEALPCCILSKAWHAACLDLLSHATTLRLGLTTPSKQSAMVHHILASHTAPALDNMEIALSNNDNFLNEHFWSCFRTLLDFAVSKHVRQLHIHSTFFSGLRILKSASLTRLILTNFYLMDPPLDPLGFPSLQDLQLCRVSITGANIAALVTGCPYLASVRLEECHGFQEIDIVSSRLQHLTIINFHVWSLGCLKLEARTLESMDLCIPRPHIIMLKDVSCLKDVSMHLHLKFFNMSAIWKSLYALSSVTTLKLTGPLVPSWVIRMEQFPRLTFLNLTSLRYDMGPCRDADDRDLHHFLRLCHFPALEQLIISLEFNPYRKIPFFDQHSVLRHPIRQLTRLKEIKIQGYAEEDKLIVEMIKIVEFLLPEAPCLEILQLVFKVHINKEDDVLREFVKARLALLQTSIEALPKASQSAKVQALYYSDSPGSRISNCPHCSPAMALRRV